MPMYPFLSKTYRRFLQFLRKPDDRTFTGVGCALTIKTILGLFLLNLILVGVWMLIATLFGVPDLENQNAKLMNLSYGMLVLVGVIAVPFVEELFFRFPLKYSRNYLLQFIIAMVALFAPAESRSTVYANARKIWTRIFWIFFYLMTGTFAFVHIYNYVDAKDLMLWSPLLTLTQFITGLIMGYVRVRFGFLWAWMYHGLFNLLFFSLAFVGDEKPKPMGFETFVEKQMVKTDTLTVAKTKMSSYMVSSPNYMVYIHQSSDSASDFAGYYGLTTDSIYFEQCTLEHILRILTKDSIILLGSNDVRYDIEFKRKKTDKFNQTSKDLLLQRLFEAFEIKP